MTLLKSGSTVLFRFFLFAQKSFLGMNYCEVGIPRLVQTMEGGWCPNVTDVQPENIYQPLIISEKSHSHFFFRGSYLWNTKLTACGLPTEKSFCV